MVSTQDGCSLLLSGLVVLFVQCLLVGAVNASRKHQTILGRRDKSENRPELETKEKGAEAKVRVDCGLLKDPGVLMSFSGQARPSKSVNAPGSTREQQ